jgi:uncharacterized caspase-like protein
MLLFCLVITNLYTTTAYARQRVALVVGNGDYQNAPLSTSINDAKDMATTLIKVGFEVILKTNVDQFDMENAMVAFGKKLRRGVVGLFYYSGYAVQYEGENYLIPYNAISSIKVARHIRSKAVNLDYVLSLMENAENGINIVILDAYRPSPFSFSKTIEKGLTTVAGAENMIIAYATSPGKVSPSVISHKRRNSFFTMYLLHFIKSSNLPVELMLKEVRTAVKWETRGRQKPWYTTSLDDTFTFNESVSSTKFIPPPRQPLYQVKTAMLTVRSNVDGATLFINGKNYNFIPNGGKKIELPVGKKYIVQVKKNEYTQFTKEFVLKKDRTVNAILSFIDVFYPGGWID